MASGHRRHRNFSVPTNPEEEPDTEPTVLSGTSLAIRGSVPLMRAMTVEEMEVDVRRLYITCRFHEQQRDVAIALLQQHHPALSVDRIRRIITECARNVTEIERRSDASWGRRQLINLLLRSQLRQSQEDTILQTAVGSDEQVKVLDSSRREDIYQIALVEKIVGLKSEVEESAEATAEAAERPHLFRELMSRVEKLSADGSKEQEINIMRQVIYGTDDV